MKYLITYDSIPYHLCHSQRKSSAVRAKSVDDTGLHLAMADLHTVPSGSPVEAKESACVPGLAAEEGFYDCQLLGSGPEAAESSNAWTKCEKNPGHANFIPISEFGFAQLPEKYRTQNIVDIVKTMATLTVKLVVRKATVGRPGGFCFSLREEVHVGSGWVIDVCKSDAPCTGCPDCIPREEEEEETAKDKENWYYIVLVTANHVVYTPDESEATEVQFFYDDKSCRKDKRMKSVHGTFILQSKTVQDWCVLSCTTHDVGLATVLKNNVEQLRDMVVTEAKRNDPCDSHSSSSPDEPDHFCIMVSHPHGQPKMVTMGELQQIDRGDKNKWGRRILSEESRLSFLESPISYTTHTCPGSSGAPVFMPTQREQRRKHSLYPLDLLEAAVIRTHSIGNISQGVGLSAGEAPMYVMPALTVT
ncbi:hypothetical protein PoB_005846700 [Plakobranchus ocellatus]|uniref:Serine protease n=1 Tax=Plakobranchus ocellatus TaxID=259542 RepID=A0AAV4CJT6_9GAST|nr:hypothetical protein PoB_005846700 [Plakobranchus ocellatus]